ncbi:MAG TPA: Mu transposase C-terminal domain-containing protein [Nakamurella sp.]|nr:Mu transposase C-terminal domain-containing protein [Nakamurella sp.]
MDAPGRWQILRLHVEDQIPLAALARETGIGVRTLQRWHAQFQGQGAAGLERRTRRDAGTRRVDLDLVRLVEGLALTRPRPAVATIHRLITQSATARGLPVPSYGVVRQIVQDLDPAMVTLALDGPASYRDKHELVLRRRAGSPNVMWQADHTELDIVVRGSGPGPVRPWLTVIEDDYSRAVCGYYTFTGAPSAMHTSTALRQAIWRKADPSWQMCGLPDIFYVDHGSDFTSGHLRQTMIDLHIRMIHSGVARPQGRGKLERFFGTINTEVLASLPGHLAPGARRPDPVLTVTELDHAIGAFVTTYNDRTHQEIGVSPRQAWLGDGWLPRMPDSLEALDGFLLHVAKPRVVQRDGIHFQGLRYLAPTLAAYVGAHVTIRYDPRDISEIRVFDHDAFVCTAIDEAHPDKAFSLKDIETARNTRRRQLRAGINERIAVVARPLEPPPPPAAPPRRKPRLRVYQEDDP